MDNVACGWGLNPTSEAGRGYDLKFDLLGLGVASGWGVLASEASLPPESSQVVAEGNGLQDNLQIRKWVKGD